MTLDLTLAALTYGGDAMGRLPDGRAVFVPFALPGETVRVRVTEEKRGHARAELLEVLNPSPRRIRPRCRHFGICGGCHYQHLAYAAQLEAKTAILTEQLERIGGVLDPPIRPVVPSPNEFNYRNHVQFHLDSAGRLGYHRALANEVHAIQECFLPEEAINAVWPQLDFENIPGLERIGLRLGAEGELQLILESNDPQPPEFSVEEMALSAVHLSPAGTLVLAGSEAVVMEALGRPFKVSAGSFFQVNTPMAEVMITHVLDILPLTRKTTVLDVYCGVGLFSAFLAERTGRLIGIESAASACQDFMANLDEFETVELYEASAEQALPLLAIHPDIVVVDPPRAGLDRYVLDRFLEMQAPILAYVSCDPATLARDARRLAGGGYQLTQITPFDLFPQTYHIESISIWER